MMAQARANKSNSFAIWVSVIAVAAIVAVGALVVWMNNAASGPGTVPEGASINTETGAIAVGSGDRSVDTYIDFMCPVCGQFEQTFGPTLDEMSSDGEATLNLHPISILDRASQGTEFSTRSAASLYAVAVHHPELALPYLQALFAQQPEESTPGLTDEQLVEIANSVGATDAASDITEGTYTQYVRYITAKTPLQPGINGISTPTIAINGEVISNQQTLSGLTPDSFRALVLQ